MLCKLLCTNSMDLFIKFALMKVSILLDFGGPFLLRCTFLTGHPFPSDYTAAFFRRILDRLENLGLEIGSKLYSLYLYAKLMFTASMLNILVTILHT